MSGEKGRREVSRQERTGTGWVITTSVSAAGEGTPAPGFTNPTASLVLKAALPPGHRDHHAPHQPQIQVLVQCSAPSYSPTLKQQGA